MDRAPQARHRFDAVERILAEGNDGSDGGVRIAAFEEMQREGLWAFAMHEAQAAVVSTRSIGAQVGQRRRFEAEAWR